jgi:hypothetical protein
MDGPSRVSRPHHNAGARAPAAHPPRVSGAPDADGFHRVQSRRWRRRRRTRRRTRPRLSRPVPPTSSVSASTVGARAMSRRTAPPLLVASTVGANVTGSGTAPSLPWLPPQLGSVTAPRRIGYAKPRPGGRRHAVGGRLPPMTRPPPGQSPRASRPRCPNATPPPRSRLLRRLLRRLLNPPSTPTRWNAPTVMGGATRKWS